MKALVLVALIFSVSVSFAKTEAELLLEVQVGQEWGKTVASQVLPQLSKPIARVAHGIAEFKRGTAFVIRTADPKRVPVNPLNMDIFNSNICVNI